MRDLSVRLALVLLLSAFMLHALTNGWLISRDTTPFVHDISTDYASSAKLFFSLKSDFLESGAPLRRLYYHDTFVPPVSLLISLPFFAIFGLSQDVALLSNLLPLAALLLGTFLLGRRLHSQMAGVLAAVLVSFYPFMFALSRTYKPSFGMVSFLPIAIYALLMSDGFSQRKYSLAFGCCAALSVLTYPNAAVFLFAPALLAVGGIFLKARASPGRRYILVNLLLCALPPVLLVTPWLVWAFPEYIGHRLSVISVSLAGMEQPWLLRLWHHHPLAILGAQLSLLGLLALLPALLMYLRKRSRERYLILAWFLFPQLFFYLFIRNDSFAQLRYSVGNMPAIALISVVGLLELGELFASRGMLPPAPSVLPLLLVVALALQFSAITFLGRYCPKEACSQDLASRNYFGRFYPVTGPVDLEGIVGDFRRSSTRGRLRVLILAPAQDLSSGLMSLLELENLNPESPVRYDMVLWNSVWQRNRTVMQMPSRGTLYPLMAESDVIIFEDYDNRFAPRIEELLRPLELAGVYSQWKEQSSDFSPLLSVELDGSREFVVHIKKESFSTST